MKVCLLTKMFPPDVGGAETYAGELAAALGERGHDVDVYTTEPASDAAEAELHENVTVERLIPRRRLVVLDTLYFSAMARRSIDFEEYDVVHGTLMPASTIALTPGLGMADVPIVVTSHGTAIDEAIAIEPQHPVDYLMKYGLHPMNAVLDAIAGRVADHVIAISEHTRERLIGTYGLDPGRISLIPHGVDTERFRADVEHHPIPDPDAFTVLYVGRLGARKGVDLAIESVARLDRSDVELLLAGSGRHERYLRELAAELGVADRVTFLGSVPPKELPGLYAAADVFVLPSSYEGYGLVLLEAMACGTPVIGTDVGGIPTVVDDGKTGTLIPRSPRALVRELSRLVDGSSHRGTTGELARDHAEALDWGNIAERTEEVYRKHRD